jgi:hypothetical protein
VRRLPNCLSDSNFDEASGKELTAGSYVIMPPWMKHYAWSTGEIIIRIHGMGPFQTKYVNPADDRRKAKSQ